MTTFPIQVVIDPSRAKSGRAAIAAELDGLERRGKQVGDTLRSAFLGVGAVFVAKKIIDYADGYVYLENRIRAADRATGDVSGENCPAAQNIYRYADASQVDCNSL